MIAQIDRTYLKKHPLRSLVRLVSYLFYEGRPLTTKGRWFNSVVFAFYRLQTVLFRGKEEQKICCIVGTGRSGSTILGVSLSVHPHVGFLNEPKALWSYACAYDDLIGSYRSQAGLYCLDESHADAQAIRRLRRVYRGYECLTRSRCICDKYPENVFRVPYIKKVFPKSKFIFLVRNGYATVQSIRRWSPSKKSSRNPDRDNWWGRDDRKWMLITEQLVKRDPVLQPHYDKIRGWDSDQDRAAVEWILSMKKGLEILSAYPDDVFFLRYEDYVADKNRRDVLLNFLGLEASPAYEDYCSQVLTVRGDVSRPDLMPEIQEEFDRLMLELGYELSSS